MKDIIVLLGKTASGKDSLMKMLIEDGGYYPLVSHTTRPIRPNETDGVEYHFISKEKFKEMEDGGGFIETREYNTLVGGIPDVWYYGLTKKSIRNDAHNVVILDIDGYRELKKVYRDRVLSFYLSVDDNVLLKRAVERKDDLIEFRRRLEDDNRRFTKKALSEIDFVLMSSTINDRFNEVMSTVMWYENKM